MSKSGKLVGVCNGIWHCGLTDCSTEHDLACEHSQPTQQKCQCSYLPIPHEHSTTQQKDAGENKRIEQILMEHDGDDCLREDIQQLVTQARQQAFQECLEAVGNDEDEDKLKLPVGSSPFYSAERIKYEAIALQNRNVTRKKIRANIEKLMK